MTQPSLFFASGNAGVVAMVSTTEVVVATLAGVVTPLGPQTIQLHGAAFIKSGSTTTALTLRIRRASLTGTLVGDQTPQDIYTAAADSNWYPVNGSDTPGEVTGAVYVLTAQSTGGGTGGTTVTAFLNAVVY